MKSRRSDAHLLFRGLRRRLPRDEFPALRCFCPGVEEDEPQAARLAVDLRLDRRAAGDECGVAHETHLAIAAGRALVLRLSRAQGRKPRRLGIGEARGVGIEKLVVKHRLERSEIAAAHRRITLVLEGEVFPCRCSLTDLPCGFSTRFELAPAAWCLHSITSSARASSVGEISRPSALAVLRLITSSNLVGCSTGSSAGLAPLKILSRKAAARSKLCDRS